MSECATCEPKYKPQNDRVAPVLNEKNGPSSQVLYVSRNSRTSQVPKCKPKNGRASTVPKYKSKNGRASTAPRRSPRNVYAILSPKSMSPTADATRVQNRRFCNGLASRALKPRRRSALTPCVLRGTPPQSALTTTTTTRDLKPVDKNAHAAARVQSPTSPRTSATRAVGASRQSGLLGVIID